MKKILVTGVTGNVGRYVCSSLLDMGEPVKAGLISMSAAKIAQVDSRAECVLFDFENQSTFSTALQNVDRVFLMRPPHLGKPEDLKPFITAMKNANIRLVSFLSLMGVEKNPIPPHHKIEKYLEKAGIPYAHIRPGFFMQNLTGAHLPEIRDKGEIFIPAGNSKCSFIDSKDIGYAAAVLLANPDKYRNTAHTLTGPESLDYFQIAKILTNVLGRKIVYQKPSIYAYRKHMLDIRRLDREYVNVTIMLYLMTRLGTAKRITEDYKKLTGRMPRTVEMFVKDNASIFSE
ncbi:MAG TPA: NAD(P)-dependent oxidoreductase [Desulfosporosinus sp.]|nr:NAD(P)-dependent oxidoreductase [Desulfosporosinus sp.]